MKNLKSYIVFFIVFLFCNQKTYAQAGTLDESFGNGGIVVVNAYSTNSKSIIQVDGKILIYAAGYLNRFNPDGTYDVTFGNNGQSRITFDGFLHDANNNFALQTDGKIVCTGKYYHPLGYIYSGVFRCNSDGTLDSSFGSNGLDTVKIDNEQYPTGIVVQNDGKIVVSGDVRKNYYDEQRTYIYRLMPDGGLDPAFGENGIVVNKYAEFINSIALILRPNGKLVIGSLYNILDAHSSYQLESFNVDGTVDAGFGTNGIAQFIFGEGQSGDWYTLMNAMTLQPDGKIIGVGTSGKPNKQMALCRFNENGSVDINFGENGGVITPFKNKYDGENLDVTLQPDGKILTCGDAYNVNGSLLLVRYTENGQLDPTFGDNGITATPNDTTKYIEGSTVHVLPDGKILVTGSQTVQRILLARYNGNNVLAANFKEVKAFANKDAITITWQTLNETGTKSFTVERSGNANDYVGITTVPAKGVASNYSYTDKNPLDGISYYRIRENAANGTNTFSPVVKVVFNDNGIISLYPNPAKNTVTVKGLNKNSTAIIKITDMQGREISSQNFTQSSSAILNIRALALGTYFVQVAQEGKVVRLKLIKE